MRIFIICLVVLSLLPGIKSSAASVPSNYSSPHIYPDSPVKNGLLNPFVLYPSKKAGFIKKLQVKLLQKRLKQLSTKPDEGTRPKVSVLSIISLVLGLIGVIGVFAGISPIFLLASLAALITGIVALGKRKNNSRGSKAMAIIGAILGGGLILFLLIVLIAWSAGV